MPTPEDVMTAAATAANVPPATLTGCRNDPFVARYRQAACAIMYQRGLSTIANISSLFRMNKRNTQIAVKRHRDGLIDKEVAAVLELLKLQPIDMNPDKIREAAKTESRRGIAVRMGIGETYLRAWVQATMPELNAEWSRRWLALQKKEGRKIAAEAVRSGMNRGELTRSVVIPKPDVIINGKRIRTQVIMNRAEAHERGLI